LQNEGVKIGEVRDPLSPVHDLLHKYRISVADATIYRWRTGDSLGEETAHRILAALILEGKIEPKHVSFFSRMVDTGLQVRDYQQNLRHRYKSDGFTATIGINMGINEQDIRQILRGLRTDIVWTDASYPQFNDKIMYALHNAESDFVTAYTSSDLNYPSQINQAVVDFAEGIDDGTARGFYSKLYGSFQERTGRGAGIFTPYEFDAMNLYVTAILTILRLSPYLQAMLESCARGESIDQFAHSATDITGIPNDKSVIGVVRAVVLGII